MITVKILKPGVNFTPETKVRLLLTLISGITTSPSLKEAFEFVMKKISQTIGWSVADVWMADPETQELHLVYCYSSDEEKKFFCEQSANFTFPSDERQAAETHWYENLQASDTARDQLFKAAGLFSAISLPITVDNEVIALFNFYSSKLLKEDEELVEYLTAVAQQLGIALKQKRTDDELIKAEAESKMLSKKLRALNDELERKVRERTLELEERNKELKEFAHVVSHDLKSPLRAVSTFAQWILDDKENNLSSLSKEHLGMLVEQVGKMHRMITDILAFAKTGKENFSKERVPINDVIHEVVDIIRPPKNIRINTCTSGPSVLYPRVHLKQIFRNLIDNAIKYSDKPQGEISVECKDLGKEWQLRVKDNGPGIPEKYHKEIFKLFNRIPQAKRNVESTGIGLSLVKKTIESNGGKIWLESSPGKGCAFNFTIPKG
ncbi:MAG: GAF domain-containing sensor histidine kinase [Bacteroidia bacterium]